MEEFKAVGKFIAVCVAVMVVVYFLRQAGLMSEGVWGPQ